jgi:hypothetical protein
MLKVSMKCPPFLERISNRKYVILMESKELWTTGRNGLKKPCDHIEKRFCVIILSHLIMKLPLTFYIPTYKSSK